MIWALLALLGIPLWFIALALIAVFKNRSMVRKSQGVFEFKSRNDKGWARSKSFGRWVSDVLIVHTGIALLRSAAAQVLRVHVVGAAEPVPKGLGEDATELEFTYAGGKTLSIAVSRHDMMIAEGLDEPPQGHRND